MKRIRWTTLAGLLLAAACVVLAWWNPWKTQETPVEDPDPTRAADLRFEVQRRKDMLLEEVARYKPAKAARIDDLSTEVAGTLRSLPGVEQVEAPLSPAKPTKRLIHLLDWHYTDRALWERMAGRKFTADGWDAALYQIELVQNDQAAALRFFNPHSPGSLG